MTKLFAANTLKALNAKIAVLILTITVAALMVDTPFTNAKRELNTYMHLAVVPNPVGVNQPVGVSFLMVNVPPPQYPLDRPRYGYWENITITVTKPDGKTDKIGPLKTGEAGAGWASYTPDQVGTYYFQANFPGQTIAVGPQAGDYYKPCTSTKVSLKVQQEPIQEWPPAELPRDYWETPIYGENREWGKIAANWLGGEYWRPDGDGFNPNSTAPNTSHILWTKQEMFGGIAGFENYWSTTWYTGRRPSSKLEPPVIIGGKLYYNEPPFFGEYGAPSYKGFKCVDLYTGETLWKTEFGQITMGQVFYFWSVAQEGVFAYLWSTSGSTWSMYDAWTGRWILNITGVPSGRTVLGAKGELLHYVFQGSRNWLARWNSTKLLLTRIRAIGVAIDWTPVPGIYNFKDGVQWNVTLQDVPGSPSVALVEPDMIVASVFFSPSETQPKWIRQDCAYSLRKGEEGKLLWVGNRTVFDDQTTIVGYSDGVYIAFDRSTLQWYGYDTYTGRQLWVSEPYDTAYSMFSGRRDNTVIAYGKIYNTGYDGVVRAIDIKTGKLVWKWYAGSSEFETPYGSWPLHGSYTGPKAADGKIYVLYSEHTPMAAPWRGGKVYCLDAEKGDLLWSISGMQAEASPTAIAYGYLVYLNGYDGQIYCFGKGPSSVSVEAPSVGVSLGSTVVVRGRVLDESSGQKGTPAVAKESMTGWMEYLHMQKPCPSEVKGVPVELYAIYPDGSYKYVDTVYTNPLADGVYGLAWTPPQEGTYTIIAVFKGDESYGSSTAANIIHVTAAQPAAATPEQVAEQITQKTQTTQTTIEATKAAIEALQPTITALIAIVVVCLGLVAYDIYINKKILKRDAK